MGEMKKQASWWNPYGWYASGLNGVAGAYWLTTASYLNDGFDYDYSVLLGSYRNEQRSYCYTTMVAQNPIDPRLVAPQRMVSPVLLDI
jgi:hypothetical protein